MYNLSKLELDKDIELFYHKKLSCNLPGYGGTFNYN